MNTVTYFLSIYNHPSHAILFLEIQIQSSQVEEIHKLFFANLQISFNGVFANNLQNIFA